MDDTTRAEIKSRIIEELRATEEELQEIEKMTEPISPENSIGRVSRMDAINNKSVMEAAQRNKRNKLAKLKVALAKVDDHRFGSCLMCGRDIQPRRLMYMPESTKCVRCAAR